MTASFPLFFLAQQRKASSEGKGGGPLMLKGARENAR